MVNKVDNSLLKDATHDFAKDYHNACLDTLLRALREKNNHSSLSQAIEQVKLIKLEYKRSNEVSFRGID